MNSVTAKTTPRDQDPTRPADLCGELLEALTEAQAERGQRQGLDSQGARDWIAHERGVMFDATVALLIRHELPIDADAAASAVKEAELAALGHIDYSQKWALRCAEYVAEVATSKMAPAEE